jgi:hypothetical protein
MATNFARASQEQNVFLNRRVGGVMKKSLLMGILAVAILLLGAVAYATADTVTISQTGSGTTAQTASDTVHATVAINPKLIFSVHTPNGTQTVDFGTHDPGDSVGSQLVTMTVMSNKIYTLSVDKTDPNIGLIGLATTLGDQVSIAATSNAAYSDNYSLNVPWTTYPGSYTANVKYTVVQN